MLKELHVRNLAVLAGASVELGPGLNTLTGETGAGKSIVVDSLALLAGARASSDLIRTGAETLTVSGVFSPAGEGWRDLLESAGLESEEAAEEGESSGAAELLVRRQISRGGRNRVYVNDQPATAGLLQELAPFLLHIHGQREELGLVQPDLQRRWLDRVGGEAGAKLRRRVADRYQAYRTLAARLESLTGDQRLRQERLDLLRFQASELGSAEIRPGEDDELRTERDQMRHREAIVEALAGAKKDLLEDDGAATDRLARSRRRLEAVVEWEGEAQAWVEELEELRIRAEELAATLRRRLDGLQSDPQRLDEVEARLGLLARLARKYGLDAAGLVERLAEIQSELTQLESDADDLEGLKANVETALDAYRKAADELSTRRKAWGRTLAGAMAAELQDLGLAQARLEVSLECRRREGSPLEIAGVPVDFSAHGYDQVVLLFAPNPGEEPQPLAKIASGGELSRLSLALQLVASGTASKAVATAGAEPTLVFDEVDTGIGGAEASALGRKLQRLAGDRQILCVTHLAQVASFGDQHFQVGKRVEKGRTLTEVRRLAAQERLEETARMLAGDRVTETSRSHARELLEGARREGAAVPVS